MVTKGGIQLTQKTTLSDLAKKFARLPETIHLAVEMELKKTAMMVRDTAVKKFGHYQVAVRDIPAWEQLKESTIKMKSRAGGGEDPLIGHYSGNSKNRVWSAPLRNTIGIHVENMVAQIGTDDPLGPIHEYGTTTAGKNHTTVIPPRPFLRPALYENLKFARTSMELAIQRAIRNM